MTLVGDRSVIDDTHGPGKGDRDYGQPIQFELAKANDESVLRALHPCVLDMREGGKRRVRVQLQDSEYGFRVLPTLLEVHNGQGLRQYHKRRLRGEWFVDIEVELVSVLPERPQRWWPFAR
eukprot:CAMPEP_0181173966 /NCGR_PEP_ID=MMETSP1096-20121128/3283_1 /TAXON_ID=156174 ORGANISM="Chrysochromulina ericina, Strain CCMP281" /NCGR_SAMPLE_ID=MMETSP1096 /ASSEMBLY_ACC=CAM_ASM_000453 /LENGTH=120 /DNA_ID=CAMNT_0023261833 /DNA_START=147 /DNA_END=509 /DNA_ORIENTATION=+